MTTSFQGPDEIVTSYEHIGGGSGRNHLGLNGGLSLLRGMGYRETSLCAPDYVSFDLKAETDRLMNRTEQLFSSSGAKSPSRDNHETVI